MVRLVLAELLKLATLPSVWLASVLAVGIPAALASLNASTLHRALSTGDTGGLLDTSTVDAGFGSLVYGTVGIVVLGVVAISSEYARTAQNMGRTRQVSTTMVATPRRGRVIAAKLCAVVSWTAGLAVVAVPLAVLLSDRILGPYATALDHDPVRRMAGVLLSWVTTAILSLTLTAVTRNGVLSLVLLVTNSSVVSVSLLVSLVTDWARYLPDTAAISTFLVTPPISAALEPGPAAVVCAGWCAAATAITFWCWMGRDA
ncbi:ABC transporter permease [Actinomyces sp. 2119]|uniref:ABC transporter permease n=1 Tax=Actinomyces sp. 2119 TaxID=2321393 RepID=UPI000E6BAA1E|nr:ABC transporter permease [Actinomyces sp. 2119]RJF43821.1 ABC transporter permease [Actinomyces sp. 2119]